MNKDQTFQYSSDAELERLASRFESCELQGDELHHRAHVALSVWYFLRLPEAEAIERIHDGLQRFVRHHNINVYNETITLFWMKLALSFVARADDGRTALELVNDSIKELGDSRIIFDYYSRERLNSDEARGLWVEPDLKPLDFCNSTASGSERVEPITGSLPLAVLLFPFVKYFLT